MKEILTQEHQYSAKNIPVIPRFSRIRHLPLASARILDCSQFYLDDAFSVIAIWTESYNKDETVRNWLFEYHRV